METVYDIQQLLKSFDILVYMKDRKLMLELYILEISELYRLRVITQDIYLRAITIIKKELRII